MYHAAALRSSVDSFDGHPPLRHICVYADTVFHRRVPYKRSEYARPSPPVATCRFHALRGMQMFMHRVNQCDDSRCFRAYRACVLGSSAHEGEDPWNVLERVSYVWLKQRWVAYPFQNNIAALDNEDKIACLTGMAEAVAEARSSGATGSRPANFDAWIMRTMGQGIADLFMRPYNFKVWAYPTTAMQCEWLGERVAAPDIKKAITNVINDTEDAVWGPNAVFRFPKRGGPGASWKGVAELLPKDRQRYGTGCAVVAIDAIDTTMPLDVTLDAVEAPEHMSEGLLRSSSHIIGIGVRGKCPHGTKCWLYYPEDDCPFYRTTVFSNYAKENCPDDGMKLPTLCLGSGQTKGGVTCAEPGPYWSLMFEVSESTLKPSTRRLHCWEAGNGLRLSKRLLQVPWRRKSSPPTTRLFPFTIAGLSTATPHPRSAETRQSPRPFPGSGSSPSGPAGGLGAGSTRSGTRTTP